MNGAPDLFVAADHRIEFSRAGGLGEIARIFLQGIICIFSGRIISGAALAEILDRRVESLRGDARALQNLASFSAFFHRQGKQKPLDRDIRVASLLRDLFGTVENARCRGCEIELPGAGALHLRQFGECEFGIAERVARAPPCPVDEAGGEPLLVVEKNLQDMFGRKLLVPFADGERLGALNEPPRPFGIFFNVHGGNLSSAKLPLMPVAPRAAVGSRQPHATHDFGIALRGKSCGPTATAYC